MTIFIPGGHLTPALALIDYVAEVDPKTTFIFLGREYSQDILLQKSHEASEVSARPNVKFVSFAVPRTPSRQPWSLVMFLIRMVTAVFQASRLYGKYHPDALLSFGGYQAVPLALIAWIKNVPIVTHEQTKVVGQATQFIANLAKVIAVSHESTVELFSPQKRRKVVVTGNPVRASLQQQVARPSWLSVSKLPLLFVTGGNQGALAINQVIGEALPLLTKDWMVVHQCGNPTREHHYQEELQLLAKQLPPDQQTHYHVQAWFSESELAWIWQHSFGMICRAGANTVSEVVLFQMPSIFVPLPSAVNDEQWQNIADLVANQAALHLPQSELNASSLLKVVKTLQTQHQTIKENLAAHTVSNTAAAHVWRLLKDTIKNHA